MCVELKSLEQGRKRSISLGGGSGWPLHLYLSLRARKRDLVVSNALRDLRTVPPELGTEFAARLNVSPSPPAATDRLDACLRGLGGEWVHKNRGGDNHFERDQTGDSSRCLHAGAKI